MQQALHKVNQFHQVAGAMLAQQSQLKEKESMKAHYPRN